jgi:hypothetical protein
MTGIVTNIPPNSVAPQRANIAPLALLDTDVYFFIFSLRKKQLVVG